MAQHHDRDVESQQQPHVSILSHRVALLAWMCLAIGTLSTSAVGPSVVFLVRNDVPSMLTVVWRNECTLLLLLPLLAHELFRTSPKELHALMTRPVIEAVMYAGMSWGASLCLWVLGLQFTTTVRGALFASLAPLVIIAYYFIRGQPVARNELMGVALATLGTLVCVATSGAEEEAQRIIATADPTGDDGESRAAMVIGDVLCILSACFTAVDFIYSARARQSMPLITFTFCSTLLALIACGAMSLFFESTSIFSTATNGFFGWTTDRFRAYIFLVAFFIGVIGILGYNISLKYISPLVLSIVGLTEPALTALIAWAIGFEQPPTAGTWFGGLLVMLGTLLAVYQGSNSH